MHWENENKLDEMVDILDEYKYTLNYEQCKGLSTQVMVRQR